MTELSARAREYFGELQKSGNVAGAPGAMVAILAGPDAGPRACADRAEELGVHEDSRFYRDCADLVIGYVTHLLDNGALEGESLRDVSLLKARLRIRPGDFTRHRVSEVSRILQEQLELLLADGRIDREEDLYQVELQAVFDLGYDEYLGLIRGVLEHHWTDRQQRIARQMVHAPAQAETLARELTAIEPLYRLATGRPRSSEHPF